MDFPGLLLAALLCAEVAAVGLAVRHAREPDRAVEIAIGTYKLNPQTAARFRRWRWRLSPLVALLAFALVDEVAALALHAAFDGAPRPLAGWYRAGWHVSVALSLGWPAALAWAANTNAPSDQARGVMCRGGIEPHPYPERAGLGTSPLRLAGRAPHTFNDAAKMTREAAIVNLLAGGWVGLLAGLAIVYPPSRAGLRWTLLTWELACTALAWWGLWRARRRTWGAVEVCLVVLVSCETMVATVGPFASDPFLRWWIGRCFYLGTWGLVCGVLIKRRRSFSA